MTGPRSERDLTLLWSPRSPFARKVAIAVEEMGVSGRIERVETRVALTLRPNPAVLQANPLGKIPALIRAGAPPLFDSRVICEYLAGLDGAGALLPSHPEARIACLRWQALGDGLADVLLLWRTETARGAAADPRIAAGFDAKVRAAMALFEAEAGLLSAAPLDLGHIAIACALDHLDFRYPACDWRVAHPALAAWHGGVATRPAFVANPVVPDPTAAEVAMSLDFGKAQ